MYSQIPNIGPTISLFHYKKNDVHSSYTRQAEQVHHLCHRTVKQLTTNDIINSTIEVTLRSKLKRNIINAYIIIVSPG